MGVNGLGTEPPLTSELSFERRWSVRLRAGARVSVALGLLALVVTVVAAAALVIAFATNATSAADTATPKTIDGTRLVLLLVVALGSVVVAATWRLWRVVTRDGQWVPASPILPAVVERRRSARDREVRRTVPGMRIASPVLQPARALARRTG